MNTTTNRPTVRIRNNYRHLVEQFINAGQTDAEVVDMFTDDYVTATMVAKVRAQMEWDKANPIVLGPNWTDLPLHHRPVRTIGGVYLSVEDATDRSMSCDAEMKARRQGRTVWTGNGWTRPVEDAVVVG